ncbi:hypothetical protein [Paenibacillus macquariensis]|uniref:PH domain-containing protein n=1 Tax=Paenibacillus macquariensis TaxID=948756 RepID=A0ABY1K8Z0_9BACL|nr:hypothetical protein [Paenibacillus macquariensis]MEC0091502.1 hypothetical protein [Paenibacillus macquariensis]OAB26634.1 hypothetical protein PMSM_26060 [Paenibacillus macquariensis subsp. macquariensis]SIR43689.1 hypothetical protein SAMN05421578_1146 [Paenibacillus macquariensis]
MELSQFKYTVRNPSGIKNIISMAALCALFLINGSLVEKDSTILRFTAIVIFCFSTVVMLWSIYRTFKKPIELYLHDETILLNGRIIKAEQIKVIMSMGDSKNPVIGIKPYRAQIIPINMCFRFVKNGEKGVADLAIWAERNNVKFDNTFFIKWI